MAKTPGVIEWTVRYFGEMHQRDPEFGTPFSRDDVAHVIGIAVDEIPSEWPIQPVSTGLTFTIVPFRSGQTLSDLKFSYIQAAEFLRNTGWVRCQLDGPARRGA